MTDPHGVPDHSGDGVGIILFAIIFIIVLLFFILPIMLMVILILWDMFWVPALHMLCEMWGVCLW